MERQILFATVASVTVGTAAAATLVSLRGRSSRLCREIIARKSASVTMLRPASHRRAKPVRLTGGLAATPDQATVAINAGIILQIGVRPG